MPNHHSPTWLPLTQLPVVARAVADMADDTGKLHHLFLRAKDTPWVLDDATVNRAIRLLTERLEILSQYAEQLHRWKQERLTQEQQTTIAGLQTQTVNAQENATQVLTLAKEIKLNTIERILNRDEAELALDVLSGKLKLPKE